MVWAGEYSGPLKSQSLWNQETFDHIASMSGGLLEIHNQTKEFSVLSEARIQVQAIKAANVQQIIINKWNRWLPVQLIPQISMKQNHTEAYNQHHNLNKKPL